MTRQISAYYDRPKCNECRWQVTKYVPKLKGVVAGCFRYDLTRGLGYPHCFERREDENRESLH